jgi:HPt (histidine-containing phosphotransfer) domain-containing protein
MVDFAYLEAFAAGDRAVVREVLVLFREQAQAWAPGLTAAGPDWRDLAHTIKGAGRGVGAFALGDACARAEAEGEGELPAVQAALADAVAAIDAYLARG